MSDIEKTPQPDHIALTADIVSAYVSNNSVPAAELGALIASVNSALAGLGKSGSSADEPAIDKATAAQIRKSVTPNGIVSFIDGKSYKTLRRHLTGNGLDPASYRERYGLPADYPMVAASYSAARAELAKSLGLGLKRRKAAAAEPAPEATPEPVATKPKGRGRKKAETPMAAE